MKGGAWATETKGPYHHCCIISGFIDKSQCHECEWALKHIKNRTTRFRGPEGRIKSIAYLLTQQQYWSQNKSGTRMDDCHYSIDVLPKWIHALKDINDRKNVTIRPIIHESTAPDKNEDENEEDYEIRYQAQIEKYKSDRNYQVQLKKGKIKREN